MLGPCTAPIARIKGVYRFHLILKAGSRKALNAALRGMLAHAEEDGGSAAESGGGCGCAAADVREAAGLARLAELGALRGGLGTVKQSCCRARVTPMPESKWPLRSQSPQCSLQGGVFS